MSSFLYDDTYVRCWEGDTPMGGSFRGAQSGDEGGLLVVLLWFLGVFDTPVDGLFSSGFGGVWLG
ncbi:hypothetical protein, partial [uncultured Bifidobacterium sp.]|uniref:hypothetical protein n=1 Tax=uncultured Bifidobacterium sp. TaxID=165187 RepID=UPI0025E9FFA2